jgi:hypothetical protein
MLILESSGGRNVFAGGDPVTEELYRAYLARRDTDGTTGVGPTQLTFAGYQDQADALGGCWVPRYNCRVGFGALAGLIERYGHREAFGRYNGGTRWTDYPSAIRYADSAMTLLPTWQAIVAGGS